MKVFALGAQSRQYRTATSRRMQVINVKRAIFAVVILIVAWPVGAGSLSDKAAPGALSKDALEIYGDFLDSYVGKNQGKVNLVETTSLFQARASERDSPCLKHFTPEVLDQKAQTTHTFDASLTNGRSVVLVDPQVTKIADPEDAIHKGVSVDDAVKAGFAAGQLRLSEIVFDKSHKYAIFSYSFHCGRLCGSGATVLLVKVDKKWVRSDEGCGSWIS
jgi:hypothetical protein